MSSNGHSIGRRQAFALAAALALTVLTGGAAVTGLRHAPPPAAAPQVVQLAQPQAPAAPPANDGESD